MKLFFIDETERQRHAPGNKYYFMLCGLIIDSKFLIKAYNALNQILLEHKIKNLKETRKDKSFSNKEKLIIARKVFIILKDYNVKVRAIYLNEEDATGREEITKRYITALDFLVERFCLALKDDNGDGIIIHDKLSNKEEGDLRSRFYRLIEESYQEWWWGDQKNKYKNFIFPSLFFSDDDFNVFLQVSDLIAVSLNSAIWKSKNLNSEIEELYKYNKFLEIYWPLFVKNPRNQKINGWGLKVWE